MKPRKVAETFFPWADPKHMPLAYCETIGRPTARFMRGLNEGLSDIEAGRVHEHDEVMAEMKKRFGGKTKRK